MVGRQSSYQFRVPLDLAVIAGVFLFDWMMPLGWSVWLLYLLPIAYAYLSPAPRDALYLAATCTVLVYVAILVSPAGIPVEFAILNRSLGATGFWLLALLINIAKQSQANVRSERDLSNTIINSLPGVFYLYDEQRQFLRWNRNFETVTGYSSPEMLQRHPLDFFAGGDKQLLAARIEQVFRTGSGEVEADFVSKTGKRTPFYFNGVCVEIDGRPCLMGMGIDITERRRAEVQRDRLFNLSIDMLCVASFDGFFEQVNPAWQKTLGWSETELLDKPWLGYVHPDDQEATTKALEELTRGQPILSFENRYRSRDGSYRWVSWNSFPLPDERLIISVARDVTEIKRAEAAVRENEARLKRIFEQAGDGIFVISADNRFIDANPRGLEMLGYRREEFLRLGVIDIIAPHERGRLQPESAEVMAGRPHLAQWEHLRKDGSTFPAEVSARRLNDGSYLSIVRDLTERKRAEEALRASERRLRDLIDGLGPNLFVGFMTADGILIEANRPALQAARLNPENVLGKPLDQAYWWTHCEKVREQLREAITRAAAGSSSRYDVQVRVADGRLIWIDFSIQPLRDATGRIAYLVPSAAVIDDRKCTEDALRESNARLQLLIKSSNIGLWDWNLVTNDVYFSPEWKSQLGYTDHEVPNRYQEWESRLHPDDRTKTMMAIKDYLEQRRKDFAIEFRLRHKDGSWRWIYTTAELMRAADGRPTRMMGCHIDITERKQVEESLRGSERQLREAQRLARIGSFTHDLVTGRMTSSDQLKEIFDVGPEVELDFDGFLAAVHPDDREAVREQLAAILRSNESAFQLEYRLLQPSRPLRQILALGRIARDSTGKPLCVVGTAQDISERKQAEESLRVSEERLRLALDAAHMGTFDWDVPHNRIAWSRWHEELWGYAPGEFTGTYQAFAERVHPDDLPGIDAEVARCMVAQVPFEREFRVVWPDGSVHWVLGRGEFTCGADGRAVHMRGVVKETTERKLAQLALQRSEAQLAGIIGSAMDGVITIDEQQNIVLFNAAAEQLFGYARKQVIGQSFELLIPERFRTLHHSHLEDLGKAGVTSRKLGGTTSVVGLRSDGREFPMEATVAQIEVAGQRLYTAIVRDVSERLRDEAQIKEDAARLRILSQQLLQAQESERRKLARELHDEIGQVLSAVKLNLITLRTPGAVPKPLEDSLAIVNRAISQVRAMSLDLRPAMLDDLGLAPALRWYLDRQGQRGGFKVQFVDDSAASSISGDTATVCFRVVQEAVTNVIRHAHAKLVQVEMRALPGWLELSIIDDGIGFDLSAAREKARAGSSLGLLGMEERVHLAGGQFAIESAPGQGAKISIRFKLPVPSPGLETRID